MSETVDKIPPRLREIIEEFDWFEGQEKLQLLLEYSQKMPPLPDWLDKDMNMDQVHECMTPVFVHAELENGGMVYYFDIPPESPTVRGYAALLAEGLRGVSPQAVIDLPNNFYQQMGLHKVLTSQRLRGISAMLMYLKRLASKELEN